MPRLRFLLLLSILVTFAPPLVAQQPPKLSPPPAQRQVLQPVAPKPKVLQPVRDPEAVTAIQAAITALGGDSAISQVQSLRALGQAKAPKAMGGAETSVTWEKSGVEFRMESTAAGKSNATVTGRGKPASISDGAAKELPEHVTRALFVPTLVGSLLRDALQDANSSIGFAGSKTLGNKKVSVVRIASIRPGDTYVIGRAWYLDSATSLPLRIEYGVPSVQTTQIWFQSAVDLSDYRTVGGVQYPFKIVTYQQGQELRTVTLQTIEPNASITAADFDAPAGGAR